MAKFSKKKQQKKFLDCWKMTDTQNDTKPVIDKAPVKADPTQFHSQFKEMNNKPVRLFQFVDDNGKFIQLKKSNAPRFLNSFKMIKKI